MSDINSWEEVLIGSGKVRVLRGRPGMARAGLVVGPTLFFNDISMDNRRRQAHGLLTHVFTHLDDRFLNDGPVLFMLSGTWEAPRVTVFGQIGFGRCATKEEAEEASATLDVDPTNDEPGEASDRS